MALDRVLVHTPIPVGSVGDLYEVTEAGKVVSLRIFVTNSSSTTTTYSLYLAPIGVLHDEAHIFVDNELVSSPGSGVSKNIALRTGDILRGIASATGLKVMINGPSEDV